MLNHLNLNYSISFMLQRCSFVFFCFVQILFCLCLYHNLSCIFRRVTRNRDQSQQGLFFSLKTDHIRQKNDALFVIAFFLVKFLLRRGSKRSFCFTKSLFFIHIHLTHKKCGFFFRKMNDNIIKHFSFCLRQNSCFFSAIFPFFPTIFLVFRRLLNPFFRKWIRRDFPDLADLPIDAQTRALLSPSVF